ncbi:MAG: hypothetical protein QNJ09_17760 [Paracoccaceae bacterium]|nr:hypothetical protein [Paracoccaceae bacterium]
MTPKTKSSDKTDNRVRRSLLIVAVIIGLLGAATYTANPLVAVAQAHAQRVAVISGGVYVTLRTLNAFLSTAQEVQVEGSVIFVGGSAQPLKVLEPIDDTVERVAGLVFALMVATGILSVAMGPTAAVGFALIALSATAMLAGQLSRRVSSYLPAARTIGWYGAFLGLALPGAFVFASILAGWMTQDVWDQHTAIVEDITAQVAPAMDGTEAAGGATTVWDDIDSYREMAANVVSRADDLVASLIAVVAVPVFHILILPALLIVGLFLVARALARRAGR